MKHTDLTAANYHRATSYRRHQLTPHTLDWAHQPQLTKRYPALPRVPLMRAENLPAVDYFTLVKGTAPDGLRQTAPITFQQLSAVIDLTHAITARSRHAGRAFYYRSVASAGALYPFELYLAAHHVDGLDTGLYHHHLFENSLTQLRERAVAVFPPVAEGAAATFFISGIFFRSAWKYRSRAYRYVLLDAGHLLENLRLALRAMRFAFSIHLDFNDDQAAILLGLNPDQEACLVCVHVYDGADPMPDRGQDASALDTGIIQASTVSDKETAYSDIIDIHKAGGSSGDRSTFASIRPRVLNDDPLSWIDLTSPKHAGGPDYRDVLWQRRSRRNFIGRPASMESFEAFSDLLTHSMGGASGMPAVYRSALVTGFLIGDHMPIPGGFYILDTERARLRLVCDETLLTPMAGACLDQMWLKHAGLHVLLMTDIVELDRRWGARGYRYVMIEAGRLGQQAYLSATALGWGACGIGAIYDGEAAKLLNLAPDASLLYLVGAGPVKKH